MNYLFIALGYSFGFILPALIGLAVAVNDDKDNAKHFLKILCAWLALSTFVAPITKTITDIFSTNLWPIIFLIYSIGIFSPKSDVIKNIDLYSRDFISSEIPNITGKLSMGIIEKICSYISD